MKIPQDEWGCSQCRATMRRRTPLLMCSLVPCCALVFLLPVRSPLSFLRSLLRCWTAAAAAAVALVRSRSERLFGANSL
jgi:hypothetical protein